MHSVLREWIRFVKFHVYTPVQMQIKTGQFTLLMTLLFPLVFIYLGKNSPASKYLKKHWRTFIWSHIKYSYISVNYFPMTVLGYLFLFVVGELGYLFSVKTARFILITSFWNFIKCFPNKKIPYFISIVTTKRFLSTVVDISWSHDLTNDSWLLSPDLLWMLVTLGGKALTEHYSTSLHITGINLITIITLNIFLVV